MPYPTRLAGTGEKSGGMAVHGERAKRARCVKPRPTHVCWVIVFGLSLEKVHGAVAGRFTNDPSSRECSEGVSAGHEIVSDCQWSNWLLSCHGVVDVIPPSTTISCPVTYRAWLEARKTTAAATSSAVPILPIGTALFRCVTNVS